MGVVQLAIVAPQTGQHFEGAHASSVRLRGELRSSGHGTLYYRWYSSLADALNGASDNPFDFTKSLAVGSHVLTFTTKDVPGDTLADIEAVEHAGMAGGPPKDGVEAPCVVHVFVANIVAPEEGETLSKANDTLTAVAPSQWGTLNTTTGAYELNPDYHEVNKIHYRWIFQPSGPPENRGDGELEPGEDDLVFGPGPEEDDPMVVSYQGSLPSSLDTGAYTLTLRVEDKDDPTKGHKVSRAVVLT
jgi:hypothetical protein